MGLLSRFKLNSGGIQEYLDGGHGVEELLDRDAEAAADRARSGAPVDSGAYLASIHVETDHTDRMVKGGGAEVP
jgi:hypothetical protein